MFNISPDETIKAQATADTLLRAVWQRSDLLSDDQKLEVKSGSILKCCFVAEKDRCWVIKDASVDGRPVPQQLRLIQKGHWAPVAEQAEAVQPAPDQAEEPTMEAPAAPAAQSTPAQAKDAEDKDAAIRALLDQGKSVSAIAKTLKIGRARIKRIRGDV
jgi:hypothetical protein